MSKHSLFEEDNVAALDRGHLIWFCVGCDCLHTVPVEGEGAWGWNGRLDKPTITPSVLNTWPNQHERRCHIYLTDGVVEFLGDCHHSHKGTKQPLSVPDDMKPSFRPA